MSKASQRILDPCWCLTEDPATRTFCTPLGSDNADSGPAIYVSLTRAAPPITTDWRVATQDRHLKRLPALEC